jgi:hypothetical protein
MTCCDYIEHLKYAFTACKIVMSAFLAVKINLAQRQSNNPVRYHRYLSAFLKSVISTNGSLDHLCGQQFLHAYKRHLFQVYGGWNETVGGGCTRFQTMSNFPLHRDDDDCSCRSYVATGENDGKVSCTKAAYSYVVKQFKDDVTLCGDLNSQKVLQGDAGSGIYFSKEYLLYHLPGSSQHLKILQKMSKSGNSSRPSAPRGASPDPCCLQRLKKSFVNRRPAKALRPLTRTFATRIGHRFTPG